MMMIVRSEGKASWHAAEELRHLSVCGQQQQQQLSCDHVTGINRQTDRQTTDRQTDDAENDNYALRRPPADSASATLSK